jgi:hypothetical protein
MDARPHGEPDDVGVPFMADLEILQISQAAFCFIGLSRHPACQDAGFHQGTAG